MKPLLAAIRPSRLAALLVVVVLLAVDPLVAAYPPPVRGTGGAIAAGETAATEVGLHILLAGGNAADAAVAVALALAVVHPEAGNLGGGGFAVLRFPGAERELASLDFREVAPAAATRDMYLDEDGEPVAARSRLGGLAVGVPGSPAGYFELHERYGVLDWERVVAPAIRLADEGFLISRRTHASLAAAKEKLAMFPATATTWLPDGEVSEVGTRLRLPALASTLRRYAEIGPKALTVGPLATAITVAARRHGGILATDDLAAYEPAWRPPVRFDSFGWRLASMDLPSSGGIILGQTATMVEQLGYGELPRFGAERAHLLAEVWRRSFADRFRLGDPTTSAASAAELLDPRWIARRLAGIDRERATPSAHVEPWPGAAERTTMNEAAETTHISVVDGDGNLVALTTTLNGAFGSKIWVPEAGIFLNNEMDDFAAAPGRPNMYGLVQGEANAVRPGKRMLSSIAPTVAWREAESGGEAIESIVLGARGGSMIPTAVLQVFLDLIVDDDDLMAAVSRPRIHHQWLPDRIEAEPAALSPETRAALEAMGHTVEVSDRAAKVNAVRWTSREGEGRFEAAGDPRGPAVAGVVDSAP